jgi:2-polyprenyl-6-methoxyphenol hydroxylase-like FAD-dependent oxidoreductase
MRNADGQLAEPGLETFRRLFAERAGLEGVTLKNATWASLYRINVRMADRYRSGRVFIAGDAAHVHSIAGSLGMNTGIQDAYNLGWKLALVLNDYADDRLLATYEEERLPIAAWSLNSVLKDNAW